MRRLSEIEKFDMPKNGRNRESKGRSCELEMRSKATLGDVRRRVRNGGRKVPENKLEMPKKQELEREDSRNNLKARIHLKFAIRLDRTRRKK